MTDDEDAIGEITRMHGFSTMTTVLGDFKEDHEVVLLVCHMIDEERLETLNCFFTLTGFRIDAKVEGAKQNKDR